MFLSRMVVQYFIKKRWALGLSEYETPIRGRKRDKRTRNARC